MFICILFLSWLLWESVHFLSKDIACMLQVSLQSSYTYLTGSSENISVPQSSSSSSATSSVVLTRKPQSSNVVDYPQSVQHGSYTQELLKQSQNTKYLLSQGSESSRKEGINSANSSSVNLSDTSFSSGGSGQAGAMPQPGSQAEINPYHRDRSRG